jgi:predicted transcriptional regulator
MKETGSNDDWWNDLTAEQKNGIKRGIKDIEESRVIPHEEVSVKYALNKTPFGKCLK